MISYHDESGMLDILTLRSYIYCERQKCQRPQNSSYDSYSKKDGLELRAIFLKYFYVLNKVEKKLLKDSGTSIRNTSNLKKYLYFDEAKITMFVLPISGITHSGMYYCQSLHWRDCQDSWCWGLPSPPLPPLINSATIAQSRSWSEIIELESLTV